MTATPSEIAALRRRYLWMAAQTATLHNPAIRPLFARQKSRGKRGDVALGHCMRKLLHLVFAVWKTGLPQQLAREHILRGGAVEIGDRIGGRAEKNSHAPAAER